MERELPSSSQFYQVIQNEDEEFGKPMTCLSEELQSTSCPLRNPNGMSDIAHIPNIQKQVNALRLIENRKSYNKQNVYFDLDAALLADEYTRLKNLTDKRSEVIGKNEIYLDMQDKELEAIIASIAELCDLNVTVTKDDSYAGNDLDELSVITQKFIADHADYDFKVIKQPSEDIEKKQNTNDLRLGVDDEMTARHTDEEYDKELRRQLVYLKAEIEIEEEKCKKIQRDLVTTRNHYKYLKMFMMPTVEETDPRNTPNYTSITTRPTTSKLSPIPESRAMSTTPRTEDNLQHMHLSASQPTSISCTTPTCSTTFVHCVGQKCFKSK